MTYCITVTVLPAQNESGDSSVNVREHAEQCHEPEAAAAQYLAYVAYLERVVFFFSFAALCIELFVEEEIYYEHDEGYHQQYHAERYRAGYVYVASQFGEYRREYHAGCHSQTRQCHFRTHGQRHFMPFEPFHYASRHGDACHLHTAAEYHESYGGELGRSRHAFVEWRYAQLVEAGNVVEVVVEPCLKAAAHECLGHGIPVDGCSHQHYYAR